MQRAQTDGDVALERWRDRLKSEPTNSEPRHVQRPPREPIERPRTVAEAAMELGLSVHTIRAWVATRRLAHIKLGRAIRIPATEIRRIIDANTVPAIEDR
jgi:excisionase family DNA binding protein